jgi:hypothetical protein
MVGLLSAKLACQPERLSRQRQVRRLVEAAGIEPASEEESARASTSVPMFSVSPRPAPVGRIQARLSRLGVPDRLTGVGGG